jgi:subtilisin family serine protease
MLPAPSSTLDAAISPSELSGGYHRDLLVVGLRPSAGRFAAGAFEATGDGAPLGPGLNAIDRLLRTGQVRRVVPLGGNDVPMVPMGLPFHAAMGLPTIEASPGDPDAGVNLLEIADESETPRLTDLLGSDPDVAYAARVPIRYLAAPPTALAVPPVGLVMWNLQRIEWMAARALPNFQEADTIRVAVLDTGIDVGHPDLGPRIASYVHDYPDAVAAVTLSAQDIVGHGSHVAGTIAAISRNAIGIDGICDTRIHAFKIFDDQDQYFSLLGYFTYAVNQVAYRRALSACRKLGIEVINLSIGGGAPPDPHEQALFDGLLQGGTAIVAAMGNERAMGSPTNYPAAIPGVIAVGATEPNDRVAGFSNGGSHISLSAPGVGIWSTYPAYPGNQGHRALFDALGRIQRGAALPRDQDYASLQGTSMASPHVAGAVALLLANKGPMAPAAVRQALRASADSVPGMGGAPFHVDYGAGRLNLRRLLA